MESSEYPLPSIFKGIDYYYEGITSNHCIYINIFFRLPSYVFL